MIGSVPPRLRPLLRCRVWLWAGATVCCAALCATPAGRAEEKDGFKIYDLRHASAEEVETRLARMLADLPDEAETFVDRRRNRLSVRGSAEVQRLATQLIAALDRPAETTAAPAPTPRETPVLRGYRVPTGELERRASELQKRFPAESGIRVATDPRTSQLLVMAPPALQEMIAHAPEVTGPAAASALPSAAPPREQEQPRSSTDSMPAQETVVPPPASEPPIREILRLEQIDYRELEAGLERLWGSKLPITTEADGRLATLPLSGGPAGQTLIKVDRAAGVVTIEGPPNLARPWVNVVRALDSRNDAPHHQTRLVPLRQAPRDRVQAALAALQTGAVEEPPAAAAPAHPATPPAAATGPAHEVVSRFFQLPAAGQRRLPPAGALAQAPAQPPPVQGPAPPPPIVGPQPPGAEEAPPDEGGGLIGPVQIEFLEGLDVIVLRGHKRDVDRVIEIIQDIERLSAETTPAIEVYTLTHANAQAVAEVVTQVYDQILSTRAGRVSITPLVRPNALLLIGRDETVRAVIDLIKRLDQPTGGATGFQVFPLKHATAADAERTLTDFFAEPTGLAPRVRVLSDFRSNSLLVQAAPRDLAEVRAMLARIDVATSESVQEVRVFRLKNSLAQELAYLLQQAIRGDQLQGQTGQGQFGGGQVPGQFGGAVPGAGQPTGQTGTTGQTRPGQSPRSSMLSFLTVDPQGGRLLRSAILTEVRIAADARANALVVTGPAQSLDLIAALIERLDDLPPAEAQIKVFTIVNGDARRLADVLTGLFSQQQQQAAAAAQIAAITGTGQGESLLIPLRFSVDERTNSIVASGSTGDLNVIEALLLRLDEGDVRQRISAVYRLRNAPAVDVAAAINEFLRSQRAVQQLDPSLLSPFEQIEREVVVVPERVSNSLIVSATPRYFSEIQKIVDQLDARPPMVMIQVLIAQISLGDIEELGVELGVQDSLLFDRSVATGDTLVPGFAFNNAAPGNASSAASLATASKIATQGLTNFATSRGNTQLGYGGLVLSAGSDSVNVLVRALHDTRRMEVLSRPQVMTLDNQSAFIQIGSRVPRITSTQLTQTGTVNNTVLENVGILLGVTPRISPDGLVVMEIDAEKSELGRVEEGIPISINSNGDVIRSPQIQTTTAQTTISGRSGQTVILGGLITKSTASTNRRVPILGDVPVLGRLFRFDSTSDQRTELLIIMTPYIIRNDQDVDWIKQVESQRMSWCLADVVAIHGDVGLSSNNPQNTAVIYPDVNPTAGEVLPPAQPLLPPSARTPDSTMPGSSLPAPNGPIYPNQPTGPYPALPPQPLNPPLIPGPGGAALPPGGDEPVGPRLIPAALPPAPEAAPVRERGPDGSLIRFRAMPANYEAPIGAMPYGPPPLPGNWKN